MMYLIRLIFKIPGRLLREIKEAREFFYFRVFYRKPSLPQDCSPKRLLICGGEDFKIAAEHYRRVFSQQVNVKINEANSICDHIFNLLGSGPTKLSKDGWGYQPIDWHSDFKAQYRWNPKTFYKKIKYGHVKGVDIKVPWELSRFQHLNTLGQAYRLTGDKKYKEEFVNQLTDWIDTNPVAFGVNWSCTMDVAIRVANWLVAKEFYDENSLPIDFLNKFYCSIYEHGTFIYQHLEYSPKLTTNHYIADLSGLFFISVYCPYFKESASWQQFCVNELTKEIQKQVYEDGCDFEASTSYHRLVLEMFFNCELLGKRAGIEFPAIYHEKVRKMFEFSLYCIKPNGKIPQIGDNDNGRFLIFTNREILEHKYLLSIAGCYYRESSFKLPGFAFDEEAFWIFSLKERDAYECLTFRAKPLKSRAFKDAGWYIMRHNKDYCFIVCGPNGQNGRGGHAHNDKLSFELMLDGKDIVVDPGTYCYTSFPELRNQFRSSAYHNTVQFDNEEQGEDTADLFSLKSKVVCKTTGLRESDCSVVLYGKILYVHSGCTHYRKLVLKKDRCFYLVDSIKCETKRKIKINFISVCDLNISKQFYSKGDFIPGVGEFSSSYGLKNKCFSFVNSVDSSLHYASACVFKSE